MTVYVESNFVLEQSLQQEECDSCAGIIHLASLRRIALAVPAFSLAEPHVAILAKEKTRSRLNNDLRIQLSEMARSRYHGAVLADFEALTSFLIERAKFEKDTLRNTLAELLRTADVIALDAAILKSASKVQLEHELSPQDAIVLASVLAHLDLHDPRPSCFLNRNWRDFDDPDIRDRLESRGCKFFARFDEGLRYVTAQLEKSNPTPGGA